MVTDAHFALQEIFYINEELCFEGVDRTRAELDRVQRFKAIDDRLVQSEADADRFDGFLF